MADLTPATPVDDEKALASKKTVWTRTTPKKKPKKTPPKNTAYYEELLENI